MPEMIPTAQRLQHFGDSVIGEMSGLAVEHGAINLSSGYPDFDPPTAILQAAHEALQSGAHQYGPSAGLQRLRQAIAAKYNHFTGLEIDAQQHVTVTCGGTEAMLASMLACCDPGDRVAVVSPFYENYAVDAMLAGAQPVYISLRPPDFHIDRDELRHCLQQGVKALVFCNPSNPTGKVFSPDELQMIADLACEYNVVVIVDEVYEHIIFPPYRHTYIAKLAGMSERTITCGSLSKTFSITGWRLGYVIAPAEVSSGVQKIHEYSTTRFLNLPQPGMISKSSEWVGRNEKIVLQEISGLSQIMSWGMYLVLMPLISLIAMRFSGP